jgi:putative ABC transport system permease protein
MIPTIDSMKTVGLVQLPGMMTGMIVAGANPVEAVRYQILIMFSFTSAAAVTSILLSMLSYRLWFTAGEYLLPPERL